jgi:hypothetical protein
MGLDPTCKVHVAVGLMPRGYLLPFLIPPPPPPPPTLLSLYLPIPIQNDMDPRSSIPAMASQWKARRRWFVNTTLAWCMKELSNGDWELDLTSLWWILQQVRWNQVALQQQAHVAEQEERGGGELVRWKKTSGAAAGSCDKACREKWHDMLMWRIKRREGDESHTTRGTHCHMYMHVGPNARKPPSKAAEGPKINGYDSWGASNTRFCSHIMQKPPSKIAEDQK